VKDEVLNENDLVWNITFDAEDEAGNIYLKVITVSYKQDVSALLRQEMRKVREIFWFIDRETSDKRQFQSIAQQHFNYLKDNLSLNKIKASRFENVYLEPLENVYYKIFPNIFNYLQGLLSKYHQTLFPFPYPVQSNDYEANSTLFTFRFEGRLFLQKALMLYNLLSLGAFVLKNDRIKELFLAAFTVKRIIGTEKICFLIKKKKIGEFTLIFFFI
jgi:hypothetical protein